MAKKSVVARQEKRELIVERYSEKRMRLRKEQKYMELDKLPKNASPVRLTKRCTICSRKRSYMGRFGFCRICFRQEASAGRITGVFKN